MLAVITAASVLVTTLTVLQARKNVLVPDYALPGEESNAQTIPGDRGDKMESEEGGGGVNLTYSDKVKISLQEETASLMFANPGRSNHSVMLQIVIQDQTVVQSGLLLPGKQVTSLDLPDGAADMLSPGGYQGSFVIMYFDPNSGEKAMITTQIPITITVET